MDKILLVLPERCIGCRTCEMICSLSHEGRCNPSESRMNVIKYEEIGINMPMMCANCEKPICKEICPTGAISKDGSTVVIDENRCVGCRMCMIACPIGGIAFHPIERGVIKCDLCGGEPLCAKFCPEEAIQYTSPEEATIKKRREQVKNLAAFLSAIGG